MRYSLSPESYSASRLRIKKCASCVTAGSAALAVIRDDLAIGVYCKRLNIGLHEPEVRRHIPDFLKKSGM